MIIETTQTRHPPRTTSTSVRPTYLFLFLFLFRGFFVNFPFKGQGGRSGTASPAVGKAAQTKPLGVSWCVGAVRPSSPFHSKGGPGRSFIRRRTLRLAFGFLGPSAVLYKENLRKCYITPID